MDSRIMQVFYGNDCLPYKDKERTVHYPITGSCFQGAQNTTQIRFYFERIGNSNTTWVAVSKLPNGKLGSKVLETHSDTEVGEYYAQLDLSAFYTQHKGDLFISLQGYQGGVQVEYDDEEEIYEITGTPTIQATGSIKLSVNYAPLFVNDNEEQLTDWQAIAALIGTKLNIINGVYVISNIQSVIDNTSNYEDGQIFYCETNKQYYQLSSGNVVVYDNGILGSKNALIRYNFNSADTLASLRDLENKVFILRYAGKDYLCSVELYLNDILVTMLDLSQKKILSWNGLGTDTFEYMFANAQTIKYVNQTLAANQVYVTNNSGYQTTLDYGSSPTANYLVQRTSDAQVRVPLSPSNNADATSKKYVDDSIATVKANAFIVVNTSTYPTLNDFLEIFAGEEGYIYLYPINTGDLSKGYYQYIWEGNSWLSIGTTQIDLSNYYTIPQTNSLLSGKVDKTSDGSKLYGTLGNGNQTTLGYGSSVTNNNIVQRNNSGQVLVPNTPSDNSHATSKYYVDTQDSALDNAKVSKISSANKVYITDDIGAQSSASYDDYASGSFVRRNDSGGQIYVPATPTANTHASSKKYVDDSIASAISNVYKIKGSKTVAQLNAMTSGELHEGDVYNLLDSGTLSAGSIQVFTGDNVVWLGSAWDKLGTEIDWSAYDEKFISAGFFEVEDYDEDTGKITFVYATELYDLSYDGDTGIMSIEAN